MELQHFIAKIPVDGPLGIDPAAVVDVFHKWVAAQSMPGVLLVDVAELLHVPNGPGVIAVGMEADVALDHSGGTWGVLFRRKNALAGTTADRVRDAINSAAQTGVRLMKAFPERLRFSRRALELIVNDRALAPNTPETYAAALPEIETGLKSAFGHEDFRTVRHDVDSRHRFGVTVECATPFDLGTLAGSA
jgi:hypothetical protein